VLDLKSAAGSVHIKDLVADLMVDNGRDKEVCVNGTVAVKIEIGRSVILRDAQQRTVRGKSGMRRGSGRYAGENVWEERQTEALGLRDMISKF
jgi:hypothetical protein